MGSKRAENLAKLGWLGGGPHQFTECGVRPLWKKLWARDRSMVGFGVGRASCSGRYAVTK